MSFKLLDKSYEPHEVERRWYAYWEENQLFAAEEQSQKKSYSIVIPPPNVTGILHMGHALDGPRNHWMMQLVWNVWPHSSVVVGSSSLSVSRQIKTNYFA